MSYSIARKTLLLIFVLILSMDQSVFAMAPVAEAAGSFYGDSFSSFAGGLTEGLDFLESSQDLLEEIGETSDGLDSFSKNMAIFNSELGALQSDLHDVGYTENEINDFTNKLSSNQSSLTQKMKSLRKALSAVRKMKSLMFNKFMEKETATNIQKGILATEQQSLHLQLQNAQFQALKNLEDTKNSMDLKRTVTQGLNQTALEIAKKKRGQLQMLSSSDESITITKARHWAQAASIFVLIYGAIVTMFLPFRSEGQLALKTGLFGLILSFLLPLIVNLYRSWLGI